MPMNGSAVEFQVIGHVDNEVVSPVCDDSWTWNCAIESKGETRISIRGHSGVLHREPVLFLCVRRALSLSHILWAILCFGGGELLSEISFSYLSSDSSVRCHRVKVRINGVVSPAASGGSCVRA
jgi:hypothetical protein